MTNRDQLLGAIEDLAERLTWLKCAIMAGKPEHPEYAAASVKSSLKRLEHWLAENDRVTD